MYLMGSLFMLPFFFGGHSLAADDLLQQLFQPAKYQGTIIDLGENVNTVGNDVFKGSFQISEKGVGRKPSLIVRITQLLLELTIALSITMILYNGMSYIIQTGQGKEGKSLVKNVVLISVGILVSLFSVVIITLIQSIPTSIDEKISYQNYAVNIRNEFDKKTEGSRTKLLRNVNVVSSRGDIDGFQIWFFVPNTLNLNPELNLPDGKNFSSQRGETRSEGAYTVYTWDLNGTLMKVDTKEGENGESSIINDLDMNITAEIDTATEPNDSYETMICLVKDDQMINCDKTLNTNQQEFGDDARNNIRDELNKKFEGEFDRTSLSDDILKENLEKKAREYFENKKKKVIKDEDTGKEMVELNGDKIDMISAYLSEIL